uniref:Uncharacterized protein n=1 Tax=Chelonoidis abingdonii TaxID=106734 RepID=A0A8C0IXQ5_CHEAB
MSSPPSLPALSQALVSPETRKFTRVLSKPGMAAELWQSIFEVVQGSMFVVRAHYPFSLWSVLAF